jgi:predicted enzyme related to lactoylglutathione lyase
VRSCTSRFRRTTQRSQQFWGSLSGWQFQANPGPFGYRTTQIGGEQGAAITNMEPGKRGMRPYFAVEDIKAGAARVTELGGQAAEPMPVPGMGWFSACTDPQGNEFGSGRPTRRPRLRRSRPVQ